MSTTGPKVHNKYHRTAGPDAVYIGRGSPWGNPFVIGVDGDRDTVIRAYRLWLETQPELMERMRRELRGKDLVCFCKPAACHGDIILEIANDPAPESGRPGYTTDF
ncbi:DUF4326 domain-containing protein [Aeromicrobium sp. 179-A 4D2 NHS]|uniref:DUF4326 domain-containing protein n=1 Tax=Aeromicrobium sp. 179-A 4D2 NHS TaxID=3142375 RepID=UPI0039A36CDA